MKHSFWGKKNFGYWWLSETVEKIKCSPWSRGCEIASRRTIDLAGCRPLKCGWGMLWWWQDVSCTLCSARLWQEHVLMWKGVMSKPQNHVRGYWRALQVVSFILISHSPMGRIFIEFLKFDFYLIRSVLNVWTKYLWCKINLEPWRLSGRVTFLTVPGWDKSTFSGCLALLVLGMDFMGSLTMTGGVLDFSKSLVGLTQTSGYFILWVVRTSSPFRAG